MCLWCGLCVVVCLYMVDRVEVEFCLYVVDVGGGGLCLYMVDSEEVERLVVCLFCWSLGVWWWFIGICWSRCLYVVDSVCVGVWAFV